MCTNQFLRSFRSTPPTAGSDLIFDVGCTHHMVTNAVVMNDVRDTLNLGQVKCAYGAKPGIWYFVAIWKSIIRSWVNILYDFSKNA